MLMKYLSNYLSFRIWCFLTTPQFLMPHLVMMIKKLSATTGSSQGELVQMTLLSCHAAIKFDIQIYVVRIA